MKFEKKYPNTAPADRHEFEYSYVTKTAKLGQCRWCSAYTKWLDVLFDHHACSEECLGAMWRQYKDDQKQKSTYENFEHHFQKVKEELTLAEAARSASKDIIIVVRNQLDYFRQCVDSLVANTKPPFHLYIWDNGSNKETQDFIRCLHAAWVVHEQHTDGNPAWRITSIRSEANTGFIPPNNELAAMGDGEYIILLNSDTKVFGNWDRLLTGFLDAHPDVAETGYWGGHMGPDGRGFGGGNGYDVDYIPGWCLCVSRETYNEYGLFNKQLKFAYCEDADLSLRLKEAGKKIYSLHAPLVYHYQNKTIVDVEKEGEIDVRASFEHNHEYISTRWKHYLQHDRVLLHRKGTESDVRPTGSA